MNIYILIYMDNVFGDNFLKLNQNFDLLFYIFLPFFCHSLLLFSHKSSLLTQSYSKCCKNLVLKFHLSNFVALDMQLLEISNHLLLTLVFQKNLQNFHRFLRESWQPLIHCSLSNLFFLFKTNVIKICSNTWMFIKSLITTR